MTEDVLPVCDMEGVEILWTIFLASAVLIICLVIFLLGDADLYLRLAEHFGKPLRSLEGKVVWLTGASSGIGEYMAYDLARAGCKLVLSARRRDELDRVKTSCLEKSKLKEVDILVLPFDMLDFNEHKGAFQSVLNHFDHIDILINNAGRSQRAPWIDIEIEVDRQIFELDVFSVVNLTRVVLPHMKTRNTGHVVVTSSLVGKFGGANSGSYTGAKHAVHGYFECLRNEEQFLDITIACPGPVASNLLQHAFTDKVNEKYEKKWSPMQKRMKTERCSYLMTVAIANKLSEVWIANSPPLLICYINLYFPSFAKRLAKILGKSFFAKQRDGNVQVDPKKST